MACDFTTKEPTMIWLYHGNSLRIDYNVASAEAKSWRPQI